MVVWKINKTRILPLNGHITQPYGIYSLNTVTQLGSLFAISLLSRSLEECNMLITITNEGRGKRKDCNCWKKWPESCWLSLLLSLLACFLRLCYKENGQCRQVARFYVILKDTPNHNPAAYLKIAYWRLVWIPP